MTSMSLQFPWLIVIGEGDKSRLLTKRKNGFIKHDLCKYLGKKYYLLSNGSNPAMTLIWGIDRDGKVRNINLIRQHRTWAKPLGRWLIDFCLNEVEITEGVELTVAQLIEKLEPVKSPPEFGRARQFRKYLKTLQTGSIFDGQMFRTFWDKSCPKLKPEEWMDTYPQ